MCLVRCLWGSMAIGTMGNEWDALNWLGVVEWQCMGFCHPGMLIMGVRSWKASWILALDAIRRCACLANTPAARKQRTQSYDSIPRTSHSIVEGGAISSPVSTRPSPDYSLSSRVLSQGDLGLFIALMDMKCFLWQFKHRYSVRVHVVRFPCLLLNRVSPMLIDWVS